MLKLVVVWYLAGDDGKNMKIESWRGMQGETRIKKNINASKKYIQHAYKKIYASKKTYPGATV